MNNRVLALTCTQMLCTTLREPTSAPDTVEAAFEHEGDFYAFVADLLGVGDARHDSEPIILIVLSELPRFLTAILALCVTHRTRMTEERIQEMILEKVDQLTSHTVH